MRQRGVAERNENFFIIVESINESGVWIPYRVDMELSEDDFVLTTNYDRGDLQIGWPACRWRRSVG